MVCYQYFEFPDFKNYCSYTECYYKLFSDRRISYQGQNYL